MAYRIIITGGREFGQKWANDVERPHWRAELAHLRLVLDEVALGRGAVVLVQGGAPGADARAREWAEHWRHEVVTFAADWKAHGRSAGPKRNKAMVNAGADIVVAFPGGDGTNSCVAEALKAGLQLRDERGWRPVASG